VTGVAGAPWITRHYLYGSLQTPAVLSDRSRELPSDATVTVYVDTATHLAGWAIYAVPARAPFVKSFFEGSISLPVGVHTVADLLSEHGAAAFRFSYSQAQTDIGNNAYMERAYVYGHESFSLSSTTRFEVGSDGSLLMSNVSVIPDRDNFDFVSTGLSQYLNELVLEPNIDPSGIGRKVFIEYDGEVPVFAYTPSAYASDVARVLAWDDSEAEAAAYIGAIFKHLSTC